MKIFKSKLLCFFWFFSVSLFLVGGCKKDNDLIEFDLLPISTDALQLDSIVDTTINGQHYYSDTLLISNNFFRAACEENGINTADIESVSLEYSSVNIESPQSMTSQLFFNSITQLFLTPGGQNDTIAQTFDIASAPVDLILSPKNLKVYFDNVATSMPVFFGAGDSALSRAKVKYKLNFKVRGYSH